MFNFIRRMMENEEKTLGNTTVSKAKDNVSDIEFFGDGDMWKLITKAWSKKEGWMKSTKAMKIGAKGCLIQVTTQQGDNISDAITFVPGARIIEVKDADNIVTERKLI